MRNHLARVTPFVRLVTLLALATSTAVQAADADPAVQKTFDKLLSACGK